MKIPGKQIFTLVLLMTIFRLSGAQAQESVITDVKISSVLNVNFPDTFSFNKNGYIYTYLSADLRNSYEVTFFDTVIVQINNLSDFNLALKSFVAGKFAGKQFKPYDLRLTDTLIGNLPGFFIRGITDDTLQDIRKFCCFVTIANSRSYWFFYYGRKPALPAEQADRFFSSIQFDRNNIKEASFAIDPFKKHKAVGAAWHMSPELNEPMPAKETKKDRQIISSDPPPPPAPPIDRKWLVTAGKLASDYMFSQTLANKKYKKYAAIVIEGKVKEIKETDEHGITIVILDGAPAKTDVQCLVLNSRKLKNLKKGMKATFDAHCNGINGNVILSGCIYIEKPTYE